MAKPDKSGCDYYSCEDLETKCNSFHEYDSMNEKCVSKSDNSGCELKRCTDLTSECSFLLEILDINAFLEIQDAK